MLYQRVFKVCECPICGDVFIRLFWELVVPKMESHLSYTVVLVCEDCVDAYLKAVSGGN